MCKEATFVLDTTVDFGSDSTWNFKAFNKINQWKTAFMKIGYKSRSEIHLKIYVQMVVALPCDTFDLIVPNALKIWRKNSSFTRCAYNNVAPELED